jgi:soluble lytic murein transglycosylase
MRSLIAGRSVTGGVCLVSVVLLGAAPAGLPPDMRERFTAAVATHKAGDWSAAAKEFGDPMWSGTPLEDYALLYQADSALRQGDAAAARALAAQAADRTPESGLTASALIWAASVETAAGDPAAAVKVLQRVLASHPDRPDVPRTRYLLGEALRAAGDQPEAAKVFASLWLQAPASYGDAAETQLKALAEAGVTVPAPTPGERALRAERLLSGGLIERARGEAEALVAEKPVPDVRERALRVVMNTSRRLGRDEAAIAAAIDALALAPAERRPGWLLELGRLRQRRDRETALATLDQLVREHPKSPDAADALLLKAELLEAANRIAEAEKTYVRLAWAAWFRGNLIESTSRWTRLQTARGGASLRESATYWLGRAWERRGDREQAARQFGTLVRDAPRTYYGLLAAKRAPGVGAPAGASPFAFPADPLEALQGDARFARAAALRGVGLREFADEELDDLTRRAVGEPRRLYALSAAYVADERYHMALRILRRSFFAVARSGTGSPREFWEMFYPLGWRDALTAAAGRAVVDPFLVAAVVREESSFYPAARSRVGARGLMQLMPDTGRAVAQSRQIPFPDADVLDQPVTNLELGSTFFAGLLREFGDPRPAAAAYNAGPTRVREWWAGRRSDDLEVWVDQIPYNETRAFVKRVMLSYEEYRRIYGEKPGEKPGDGPKGGGES